MKKIVFRIAAGASLIMWVATVCIWFMSYHRTFSVERHDVDLELDFPYVDIRKLAVAHGGLFYLSQFGAWRVYSIDQEVGVNWHLQSNPAEAYPRFTPYRPFRGQTNLISGGGGEGFEFKHQLVPDYQGRPFFRQTIFVIPMPAIAMISAVLPVLSLIRVRHRRTHCRRAAMGLCRKCGYDLRASPARCPECGAVSDFEIPV